MGSVMLQKRQRQLQMYCWNERSLYSPPRFWSEIEDLIGKEGVSKCHASGVGVRARYVVIG